MDRDRPSEAGGSGPWGHAARIDRTEGAERPPGGSRRLVRSGRRCPAAYRRPRDEALQRMIDPDSGAERTAAAQRRDVVADTRDGLADVREAAANRRESVADQRERDADRTQVRSGGEGGRRIRERARLGRAGDTLLRIVARLARKEAGHARTTARMAREQTAAERERGA